MFLKNSTLLKFTYLNKNLKNSKKLKNFWKIDKFWEKITWPHRSVRLLGFLVNGRKCSAILFFFSNKNSWFWNMQFSGLIFCDWSAAWESNWCVFSFNRLQCIFSHFLKHEIQWFLIFFFAIATRSLIWTVKKMPEGEHKNFSL